MLCALRGSPKLHISCEKRGTLSVPSCTWSFFSVLKEGKGGYRSYRPHSIQLSDNQNVCLGGKYIIALVNLLFKHLKHTQSLGARGPTPFTYAGSVLHQLFFFFCNPPKSILTMLVLLMLFLETAVQFTTRSVLLWDFTCMAVSECLSCTPTQETKRDKALHNL